MGFLCTASLVMGGGGEFNYNLELWFYHFSVLIINILKKKYFRNVDNTLATLPEMQI